MLKNKIEIKKDKDSEDYYIDIYDMADLFDDVEVIESYKLEWKDTFNAGNPLVGEYLSKGREKEIERVNALDDLSKMLDDPKFANVRPQTQGVLREMVQAYKDYRKQQDIFELIGGDADVADILKVSTLQRIKDLSSFNENTQAAYMSIFSRLLGE